MKVNYASFIIYFSVMRPVFYFISPLLSRVSDFVALLLTSRSKYKLSRSILPLVILQILYLFVMIASLLNFMLVNGDLNPKDFFELFRPFFWIFALIVGANAARIVSRESLYRIFVIIGIINSSVAILMLFFPKLMYPLYYLYNVPNLYFHGRPGGLAYTHTEFVAINALAILCILLSQNMSRWFLLILIPASFASMSKGGILLLFIFFVMYFIVVRLRNALVFASLLGAAFLLMWTHFVQLASTYFPYLYWGFYQVFVVLSTGSTKDGSVGPRFQDWLYAINYKISNLSYLIGNSPMRNFPDVSYIESTMPNILFRYGYIGLLVFYGMYVVVGLLVSRRDRIVIVPFICALMVADMTANFSESVKFLFLTAVLFGSLCEFKRIDGSEHKIRIR